MTDPQDQPRVRNIYRGGYFPRVRQRGEEFVATAKYAAKNPRGWLRDTLRRDAEFVLHGVDATVGALGASLRDRKRRRWVLGAFALVGFVPAFMWERCGFMGCPDVARVASLQPGGAATVYDADGGILARLTPVRWEVVRITRLPKYVPQAFVAVEDQRYFSHHGVDWRRFLGTTARNLMPGGRSQGASTITMQVARNVFPDRLPASERTIKRKLLEIRVATEIENKYDKDQILQTYLNQIYFGEGVYGIESAARIYFGKHAADLALPEAALLAGLPKAPTNYNPRRNPDRSLARRNLILGLMAQQGRITPLERDQSRAAGLKLARLETEQQRRRAPYFVEMVRRVLEDRMGEQLYAGALRIRTGLDPRAQAAAEKQLEAQIRRVEGGVFGRFEGPRRKDATVGAETPYLQGSAVLMDARTGDVRAWVGGRSFEDSRFDRISQGFRQPGSAFKPFVWAAALEKGVALTDTFIDEPLRRTMPAGDVWEPRNFDGRFRGPVSVRNALRWSVNTVAVRLAERAGLDEVSSEARRMGITAKVPALPSVAIGAAALRPLELVRAYTAFATLGTRVEPRFVTRVENAAGEVLWEPGVRRRRVLDPGVAFLVTDAMRDVVDRGTGRKARDVGLRGPAAGKTGTTNGATDAWFVGFTPDVVGAVWIGFDRGRPITARGSGGELAAPVWGRMVRAAANGRVPVAWEPPGGVVERKVAVSGLRVISPGCRARGASFDEYFLRRSVPPSVCPRGAPDAPPWWERAADAAGTQVREWVREQSARLWRDVRRRAGFPVDGSAPRAEQSTRPRREEPEAREPEGVADPVTPGPRDSIFIPPVQVDTISM